MKGKNNKIMFLSVLFSALLLSFNIVTAQSGNIIHAKTFQSEDGKIISVKAEGGDVGIKAWDKNEVYIKVLGTEKAKEKVHFKFDQTDDGVTVMAEREGSGWFNWGRGISYRILVNVPKHFAAKVKTSGGDVKLIDIEGEHMVKTSGGDIILKHVFGKVDAKTSGGDIEAMNCKIDLSAATSGGDIKVKENEGSVYAGTSGGDVKIETTGGKIDAKTSGGDIVIYYSGENRGISLKTSGGDIALKLSPEINADVIFKTTGGDVKVKFPNAKADVIKSSRYEGKFNAGGKEIQCFTTGGDITVKTFER